MNQSTCSSTTRHPVLGPGEVDPIGIEKRIACRKGIDARLPLNDTLFRRAERAFKTRSQSLPEPLVDGRFSDEDLTSKFPHLYIDYVDPLEILQVNEQCLLIFQQYFIRGPLRVIKSTLFPGMLYIPNSIHWQGQKDILKCCFKEAINPPCLSNLDSYYEIPKEGLWSFLVRDLTEPAGLVHGSTKSDRSYKIMKKIFKENKEPTVQEDLYSGDKSTVTSDDFTLEDSLMSASTLIRKMRWVTLGYQYDWTLKEYIWEASLIPFPKLLRDICQTVCSLLGWPQYVPEAGILNYYQVKDTLTGHVDRSEENDSAPLISFSFGLDAIFLLGGPTREDAVVPFRLRSGDILIMSNECRRNYHGVPRILEGTNPAELLESGTAVEDKVLSSLMKDARINLNVRQVF